MPELLSLPSDVRLLGYKGPGYLVCTFGRSCCLFMLIFWFWFYLSIASSAKTYKDICPKSFTW